MGVFVQNGCIRTKWFCIRAKVVIIGLSCCNRAKWLYFGKSGCIGESWLYSGKVIVYSGKLAVFWQNSCIRANLLS